MNGGKVDMILGVLMVAICGAAGVWFAWRCFVDYPNPPAIDVEHVEPHGEYVLTMTPAPFSGYDSIFNDNQPVQIKAAKANGLRPMSTDSQISRLVDEGRLDPIHDTNLYYLHNVSYPYLVPAASDLLAEIGELYQDFLHDPYARLRLTSCLRTSGSVDALRKVNGNAVKNSCHLYGTTFDISYALMDPEEKSALGHALRDLRDAGYCYVKYEKRQPCFHITLRKTPSPIARWGEPTTRREAEFRRGLLATIHLPVIFQY